MSLWTLLNVLRAESWILVGLRPGWWHILYWRYLNMHIAKGTWCLHLSRCLNAPLRPGCVPPSQHGLSLASGFWPLPHSSTSGHSCRWHVTRKHCAASRTPSTRCSFAVSVTLRRLLVRVTYQFPVVSVTHHIPVSWSTPALTSPGRSMYRWHRCSPATVNSASLKTQGAAGSW